MLAMRVDMVPSPSRQPEGLPEVQASGLGQVNGQRDGAAAQMAALYHAATGYELLIDENRAKKQRTGSGTKAAS